MRKKLIYSILFLMFAADVCYSFVQHISQPLDGDMAWNIIPSNDVKPVLENPLGLNILVKNQTYPNPNRFFSHYSMKKYFEIAPLFLQRFVQPIESAYLSCALVKIIIQIALIFLLALTITGTSNFLKMDFLIAVVLVTPFFQTEGYQSYMGIIDRATSYNFFYALPVALLLLYLSPIVSEYYHNKKPDAQKLVYILWIPLALVICLSGPLNPGIVLIFSLLLFLSYLKNSYQRSDQSVVLQKTRTIISALPKNFWFYVVPISLFAIYSLYIGRYNSNNIKLPLIQLYSRIPEGLYYPLTKKLGFPVLIISILVNYIIIRKKYKTVGGQKTVTLFNWLWIFILLYILLLPLGGYRDYRPNVLRYDTLMPVTLCLIFMFGISTLFLIKHLNSRPKKIYLTAVFGVLLFYTINDEANFDKNSCERNALKEISVSQNTIVKVHSDCIVLSWGKIANPEDSRLDGQLLTLWNVTKTNKLYFNEQ